MPKPHYLVTFDSLKNFLKKVFNIITYNKKKICHKMESFQVLFTFNHYPNFPYFENILKFYFFFSNSTYYNLETLHFDLNYCNTCYYLKLFISSYSLNSIFVTLPHLPKQGIIFTLLDSLLRNCSQLLLFKVKPSFL